MKKLFLLSALLFTAVLSAGLKPVNLDMIDCNFDSDINWQRIGDKICNLAAGRYVTATEKITPFSKEYTFASVIPLSGKTGDGVDIIFKEAEPFLEEAEWFFPSDMITDQPERTIAGEIIREKLLKLLDKEIPHGIAVVIEDFKESDKLIDIRAEIYCEKASHKKIIIGKDGAMLKRVGSFAREDLEAFFGVHVNINLWVKVKENWRDNEMLLGSFGFKRD